MFLRGELLFDVRVNSTLSAAGIAARTHAPDSQVPVHGAGQRRPVHFRSCGG